MRPSLAIVFAAVLTCPLVLGGCVAQKHADDMVAVNRALKERIVALENEIEQLQQQISLIQTEDSDAASMLVSLQAERDALQARVDALKADNASLISTNRRLMAAGPQLPEEVKTALEEFAAKYPGLATYDEESGAVKFASDLTFGLGSADLSTNAASAITKLADVFTADAAAQYEIRIVGHTDSVRIANPATKAKHPTNWHLSVHRAISVRNALVSAGVPDVRTSVSGYGPFRPVAPNARRGAEANRRVEIFLVPMTPVNEDYLTPSTTAPASTGTSGSTSAPAGPGAIFK